MRNIAVILAGGSGTRVGAALPKQFLPLEGRAVMEYAVEAFDRHPGIDEVAVVVPAACRPLWADIASRNRWRKLGPVLDGGAERHLSTLAAVEAYRGQEANLLLHDAARPLVGSEVIGAVVEALREHEAVAVAVPSTDTVLRAEEGIVREVPPRATMFLAQTPQAFRLRLLAEAYDRALRDPHFAATDDCGLVLRYLPRTAIHLVPGSAANLKLTVATDLGRLRSLLHAEEADETRQTCKQPTP